MTAEDLKMAQIIEHSEAVVRGDNLPPYDDERENREYIEENRLIATWLKELKSYREAWVMLTSKINSVKTTDTLNKEAAIDEILMAVKQYKPKEGK